MVQAVRVTFKVIAKALRNGNCAKDVVNLGLQGKKLSAKNVRNAFVRNAQERGISSNPRDIIMQMRNEVQEALAFYKLPKDTSFNDLLKTIETSKQNIPNLEPIQKTISIV